MKDSFPHDLRVVLWVCGARARQSVTESVMECAEGGVLRECRAVGDARLHRAIERAGEDLCFLFGTCPGWPVGETGGGPLVGGFVFPALGVEGFRPWVVSEHQALEVEEEIRALVKACVRGV